MDELFARIAAETSIAGAIELARLEAVSLNAVATTFHVTAPHASQVGPQVFVATHGHSEEWRKAYFNPEIRRHDPIPDYVMRTGEAITYHQALSEISLSPQQEDFVNRYHLTVAKQTIAIPAYGPFDLDSYATITKASDFTSADNEFVQHLTALVEVTNRRVAQLMERDAAKAISLSEREGEVLHWIGRSKSNGDIATILNVTSATIDTYVRRLFGKLSVNDRISAAVKGIRLGLIRF
jgi:DNA-binding CsgD family transcriptional regulator